MKHPILTILLALCLYIPNSWAADICEDSLCNKFNYTIVESYKYCWSNGQVSADSLNIDNAASQYEYIIVPFFEDIIRTSKSVSKRPVNMNKTDYCCKHYYIETDPYIEDGNEMNYVFSIDILSFNRCDKNLMTCLEMFRQKEYAWVDVISEAPVRCLVFWAKNDFVILWYNKLKGAERAILVMKEILPQKETTIVLDKAILE